MSRIATSSDRTSQSIVRLGDDTDDAYLPDLAACERVIAVLAHELRSPLNAMHLAVEYVRRREMLSVESMESLAQIDRAAMRMAELTHTLLDFSHIRFMGELPLEPVPTDLRELSGRVLHAVIAEHPGRAVDFEAIGNVTGEWDPHRIEQVLANLIYNALVHGSADGRVRAAIQGVAHDIVLTVHNDGRVIPAEDIPHLFAPFQRAGGSSSGRSVRGLGLGLFIAREIVSAHGGTIAIASSIPDGTVVTVRLPRRTNSAVRAAQSIAGGRSANASATQARK